MNETKKRQYARLAQQLKVLQSNLQNTTDQLEVMSRHCNDHLVGQLGKIHASWFIGGNWCFEEEMLGKNR
ncbi:LAMI_0G05402g1_1 [Lachancea mirantina]|uniref:LAMI_0G05402g1_1 n=1 Tax=Lachancea mirantina TaxID=1230905 RepID=A0A1G4K8S5_9SACH|nr:LAMI_0G05402g1_1 [Lachancea mirantina]